MFPSLLALVLVATISPLATPAPSSDPANLVTLTDYFDQGQKLALRYVDGLAADGHGRFQMSQLAPSCVRVSCERDAGRSIQFSTGVLVDGGRHVVTAGHGVHEIGEAGATLSVILTSGRQIPARLVSRSPSSAADQDWAVLELTGPIPADVASVRVATARPGGLAFIMGYPERVGLGADGHAVTALAPQPTALDPLLFVARVPSASATSVLAAGSELEPLAGAVPLSGASGSPVFDETGALVGVLVAIGRLAYPDGVRHVYRVSLAGDFKGAIGS